MKPILMIALVAAAVSVSSEAAPAPWLPIPANTPRHLPMFGLPRHLPTYGLTPQNLSTTGGVTAPARPQRRRLQPLSRSEDISRQFDKSWHMQRRRWSGLLRWIPTIGK